MNYANKIYLKSNSMLNAEWDKKNIIYYISLVLLAVQCFGICYINIFQADMHLGYDASSNMLNAAMMWDQKKLLPDNYIYQTGLLLSIKTIVAALLYGITGDVCIAFGIVNIIFTAVMIMLIYSICKSLNISKNSIAIALNLFLAPYVGFGYNIANPLGYFPSMFQNVGFYSMRVVHYLLAARCLLYFIEESKSKAKTVLVILSMINAVFTGFSSGFSSMAYLIAPLFLFVIIRIIIYGDIKYAVDKCALYSYSLAVFTIAGKIVNNFTVSQNSKETSMELVNLKDFWSNLGNIFLGFASLLSAGNQNHAITALSGKGFITLFYAVIVVIFFTALLFAVTKIIKQYRKSEQQDRKNDMLLYLMCFCGINFFMYAAIDSAYGGEIFEARYMISFFVFGLFFIAYAADSLKHNAFRNLLSVFTIIALSVGTLSSYIYIDKGKCDSFDELENIIASTDAKVIYGYNTIGSNMHVYARDMRAIDTKRIYKLVNKNGVHHWGDYTYVDDVGDNIGSTVMLIVPSEFENLPEHIRNKYSYLDSWQSRYDVYYSSKNPFDYETGIDEDGYSVDLPNSDGICRANLVVNDDGVYESDGTEGYCIFGPYCKAPEGKYRFTLNYNVKESGIDSAAGVFDIYVYGGAVLGTEHITADKNSVSIEVEFKEGDVYENRVWNYSDSVIEIENIEIERID